MTTTWFSLIGLISLPILIAQWVGVIGLRRGPRGLAWGLMTAGMAVNTLSLFLPVILAFAARNGPAGSFGWMYFSSTLVSTSGAMLFAVGFAMHGLRSARAIERQGELEQLAAAMSEEIDRLREQAARS